MNQSEKQTYVKKRPSVLIIDDEKVICDGLTKLLAENYSTYQARSGREAIDIMENHRDIDVILCDILMPEMEGTEVIKHIRSDNREVTVIVITAYSDPLKVCEAMRHGANSFLLKPIDIPLLEKTIQNAITKKIA